MQLDSDLRILDLTGNSIAQLPSAAAAAVAASAAAAAASSSLSSSADSSTSLSLSSSGGVPASSLFAYPNFKVPKPYFEFLTLLSGSQNGQERAHGVTTEL